MDRLTKLASKLYPRWWRQRYGEEFAALLEDASPGPGGALDIFKGALAMQLASRSSWKTLIVGAVVGSVAAVSVTFLMTPLYSSNAAISIRPPQNPAPSKEGATAADIVERINLYSSRVLSRSTLTTVIRDLNLYPDERNTMPNEDVLTLMRQNIRVSALAALVEDRMVPVVALSFQYPDRVAAQKL